MSSTSTLSEQIFEFRYTGRDPSALSGLAAASALTATEFNYLSGATAANSGTNKAMITGTSGALTIAGTLTLGATALTATATELNTSAGVTLGTVTASKNMTVDANKGVSGFRSTAAVNPTTQAAANTLNSSGTLTAAMMLGGIVTSTTAAGVTATLDTGTNMDTAYLALFAGGAANDYIEFSVVNTGGNSFTVATAGGWTDGGNGFVAVATATSAKFGCRRTGSNAWTIFKVA